MKCYFQSNTHNKYTRQIQINTHVTKLSLSPNCLAFKRVDLARINIANVVVNDEPNERMLNAWIRTREKRLVKNRVVVNIIAARWEIYFDLLRYIIVEFNKPSVYNRIEHVTMIRRKCIPSNFDELV